MNVQTTDVNPLEPLRRAAEAAGPEAVAIFRELLESYAREADHAQAMQATCTEALAVCERVSADMRALEEATTGYRQALVALVELIRRRQARDPFRWDMPLAALRRGEDKVIAAAHRHDDLVMEVVRARQIELPLPARGVGRAA